MTGTGERERVEKALAEVEALRAGLAGGAAEAMPAETLRAALLRALDDLREAYTRYLALLDAAGEAGTDRADAVPGAAPGAPDATG